MVLGLGSRSKKDRASAVSQLVELDLHYHEIKPWQGLARPSKAPGAVSLRSSRGERVLGSSRSLSPTLASSSELGKIVVGESLHIAVAPNREVLKRAKKSYPDLDKPLVFTLLDINDLKGKPLAQASLDLSAFAAISDSKLVAVPFTVSKKVAKGATTYLHLTVQRHLEDKASGFAASASSATSISSRTSDASSVPPLDEDTQSKLVAALLSDEEDEGDNREEEVDSFTDEEDYKNVPSVPQGLSVPQGNVTVEPVALPSGNLHQRAANPAIQQIVEVKVAPKQPERVDERLSRHAVASPQATPVKAAANAAAAAYAKKHSFLTKDTNSYMDDSDDLYSDVDSCGEDEFPSRLSRVVRSPSFLPKGPQTAASHSFLSVRRSESISNTSADKSTKTAGQNVVEAKVEKAADMNTSGKRAVVDDMQSKLNGEHRTSISSAVSTISEPIVVGGKVGVIEEKAELKGPVHITTTENISTFSLTKESNGTSREPRLELETSLRTEADNEKISGDVNFPSQRVEVAQVVSGVDSGKGAGIKHQTKTAVEMKANTAVRSSFREKSALGPPKITISKSPDQMKGRTSRSPVQDSKTPKSTIQEGKARAFKSPDRDNEKGDKKVTEESKQKMSHAEAKAAAAEKKIQYLESEVEKLKGELRDVAAVEAALYSTTAEHGSSSMKLHAPARRLARTYIYACKHWSQERRASCARNTMSGLVLVARACGNDVPRLTFWWSNATVLREIVSTAFNVLPAAPKVGTMTHSSSQSEQRNLTSSPNVKKLYQQQQAASPSHDCEDWREPSTFTSALERLESWIYTKVVESIWWQVLTPQMQQPMNDVSAQIDDNDLDTRFDVVKREKRIIHSELEDARQGNISVDIWKKACLDAFERLCPVRRLGVECGCLPMLNKLVLEACVDRLDVAMFNAILRDDEVPTDPVSDPISDVRVLPIPNSSLSFGLGAQLKNAVATLSSFLSNLTSKDGENVGNLDDDDKNVIMFPLLKAMGGLLMLPKDMLIDKSLRKEVCPTLQLPFIGRILSKFQPDEFSPEPVTPELLETINAEVAAENQKQGEMDDSVTLLRTAVAPSVVYSPPQSSMVRHWIGNASSPNNRFGRSNSSVLRKGHTSDDEIDELESPISWLLENTMGFSGSKGINDAKRGAPNTPRDAGTNRRFMLLREVWNSG